MFLLINKPSGITSHDVIDQLRKITQIKKIGHAGTLDPFAQGLLVVAISRQSTKQLDNFLKLDKTYQATLQLNAVSDTYDLTGRITPNTKPQKFKSPDIKKILKQFIGPQQQIPPIYSAKKIKGKPAYKFARQGQPLKLKPQPINIYDIQFKKFNAQAQQLTIQVHSSSGTYIRSLAHDIGQSLGTGAYLIKLTRTHIGKLKLSQAINLKELTPHNWQTYCQPELKY